ncbi:protein of unknown function [Bradyrhizobium vignae]|uniref:Uncharacterized protein n=1 Tax=Bradyrhizobium vignae TaxID=1549949 RepID=A0A2U3PUU0_9BRAD|nr:protein of unknown function [Bradyrhizobium vignae]
MIRLSREQQAAALLRQTVNIEEAPGARYFLITSIWIIDQQACRTRLVQTKILRRSRIASHHVETVASIYLAPRVWTKAQSTGSATLMS